MHYCQKGKEILKKLVKNADVLLDPYRPGVLERLELSPPLLLTINPKLIIARLTGYGQTGDHSSIVVVIDDSLQVH